MRERRFWPLLALIFGVMAAVQFPYRPARFGGVFFFMLSCACVAEYLLMLREEEYKMCRVLAGLGRVLFSLFVVSFTLVQVFIIQRGMYDNAEKADYVLVLGALVNPDGRPSAALAARCDTAKAFLDKHENAKAILCGAKGSNEPIAEAESMYKYLAEKGVDVKRLVMEAGSNNTIQNISNAKKLLDGNDVVAIVTSDYHLARARMLLKKAGLGDAGIPAPTPHPWQWVSVRCREYCSITGLILTGRWKFS